MERKNYYTGDSWGVPNVSAAGNIKKTAQIKNILAFHKNY
jgi:hypothetical protein